MIIIPGFRNQRASDPIKGRALSFTIRCVMDSRHVYFKHIFSRNRGQYNLLDENYTGYSISLISDRMVYRNLQFNIQSIISIHYIKRPDSSTRKDILSNYYEETLGAYFAAAVSKNALFSSRSVRRPCEGWTCCRRLDKRGSC